MTEKINNRITCCYLYSITRYGYPPPADGTLKYLEEMAALGFKSVELEGIRDKHLLEMFDLRFDNKAKLKELDLNIPYFCAVLPGMASSDKNIRDKNLELFEKGCEVAHLLGAKGILDNAPIPPYQFPDNIPVVRHYDEDVLMAASIPKDLSWNRYWDELINTFNTACQIAAGKDLTFQMHPALGVLLANTDSFLYFFDAVGCNNLRFNLDTANQYAMKENLVLALLKLKDHLDYIHISDNGGNRVEHLVPEKGNINWNSFFEALDRINFKGYFGLDIGGDESEIGDLDSAYLNAADWLQQRL